MVGMKPVVRFFWKKYRGGERERERKEGRAGKDEKEIDTDMRVGWGRGKIEKVIKTEQRQNKTEGETRRGRWTVSMFCGKVELGRVKS